MRAYNILNDYIEQITGLDHALSLLSWDNEVMMSEGGTEGRAMAAGAVADLRQQKVVSDTFTSLYEQAIAEGPENALESDHLERIGKFRSYYTSVLPETEKELCKARIRGQKAWKKAREEQCFELFRPALQNLIELSATRAQQIDAAKPTYQVLLNEYEEDCELTELDAMFEELGSPLHEMIEHYQELPLPGVFQQSFSVPQQEQVARELLELIGFDFTCGRLDKAVHPFCMGLHAHDVRLTNRYRPDGLLNSMYGALHEGGHGLYEQGIDPKLTGTLCGGGASLGLHESQSRLWENLVGRSQAFWKGFFPRLQARFPRHLMGYAWQDAWAASNRVKVSDIRVEADEVTYNLHIALRYDIERRLFSGELKVEDLPEAWNEKSYELLGRYPDNISRGCLQDVHWCEALFGYFPTYTIGNVVSASLWHRLQSELSDLNMWVERLNFAPLLEWLRENIYRHGRRASGRKRIDTLNIGLSAQPFLHYLQQKMQAVEEHLVRG